MGQKFADISSCHATAIEDADGCCCIGSVHLAIEPTDQMNYLTCSLSSGSTPSADSPDWLVGDHNVFSLLRSKVCQASMNLSMNNFRGLPRFVLSEVLAYTNNWTQVVRE